MSELRYAAMVALGFAAFAVAALSIGHSGAWAVARALALGYIALLWHEALFLARTDDGEDRP